MNTKFKSAVVFSLFIFSVNLFAQKRITEGTILYDIVVNTGNTNPSITDMFDGSTSIVYLKGYKSRIEKVSSLGVESTLLDGKTGTANVLKEYGDYKILISMTPENWKEANKKNNDIVFTYLEEYREIAGYKCQKALGKTADGREFIVFFTKDLIADNRDFEYAFKSLPGLAMEYETTNGNLKLTYTVSKVSFGIVPASKFELPKTGFRVMTYEESIGTGIKN